MRKSQFESAKLMTADWQRLKDEDPGNRQRRPNILRLHKSIPLYITSSWFRASYSGISCLWAWLFEFLNLSTSQKQIFVLPKLPFGDPSCELSEVFLLEADGCLLVWRVTMSW